jgi:hypothetical protein
MRPYPGPRSILLLDNCSIHHGDEVRELIEVEAGVILALIPALFDLTYFRWPLVVFATILTRLQPN